MRRITTLLVHCSATRAEWMAYASAADKAREIHRWHLDRGWSGIGYHRLIDRGGTQVRCRPVPTPGAHVRGHNGTSIGVCLIGGHGSAATDMFSDNFTPEQDKALRQVIADYQHTLGPLDICGHNDFAAKACPGFDVRLWLLKRETEHA